MELIKVNLLHKIRFRLLFVQYKKVSRTLGSTYVFLGAGGRTRTGTVSLPVDFESTTSANSITPAQIAKS